MKPFDARLLRYARATWIYLTLCVAVGSATAVLLLLQAGLLAEALGGGDNPVDPGRMSDLVTAIAVVFLARAALLWLGEVASVRSSARVKSALRCQLTERVMRLGPAWLVGERRGAVVTLLGGGLDRLDAYFARYLPQLVLAVIVPVVVLARLVLADPMSAIVVAVTLPMVPVFMALVGLATRDQTQRRWRALQVLAHHFTDVVAGLPTLKVFGRAKVQADEVRRLTEAHRRASLATLRLAFLSSLVLELLASLALALVAVSVGLRLVTGELDLETALLVLLLAPEAYLALRQVGAQYHAAADGLAAAADAFRILEEPVRDDGLSTEIPDLRTSTLHAINLAVHHPDRAGPTLGETSLDLEPGEIVAITGPSGCGKTTLLEVVLGLRPSTGQVRIGDVDVGSLDPSAWRRQLAWVPQHPHLPASTVGANVSIGRPDASAASVRSALDRAGASGLDPRRPTGQDGALLSAGERRRVAIARALLLDAPLLLLDEPTAGLDDHTESYVLENLRRQGRTALVVSHRPAVLAMADRVILLGVAGPIAVSR